MNDFTASNGVTVRLPNGTTSLVDLVEAGGSTLSDWDYLDSAVMQALREFFQAEADERLGRWRWPENPDYVVYPRADHVAVVNEQSGNAMQVNRAQAHINTGLCHAARAYFDAHPEPKPWHDAQQGEVWVLETRSDLGTDKRAWHITDRPESFWALSQGYLLVKSKSIVSGYRIWPEVSS